MSIFSERLKVQKNSHHALQKDIAEAIGVSVRAYQHYEAGTQEPTLSKVIALADFFDVSLDYLVGRCDNPASHKQ